jgi:hypothetical protein
LIYVWNQALGDYITALIELLGLLVPLMQDGEYTGSGSAMEEESYSVNALKMFPYLSYVLTGRVYPTGERLAEEVALKAKAELYWFLFSGKSIAWPKGSTTRFLTRPNQPHEPSFPYLRMILKFDAPSFLSTLNEAFEDSFLNDFPEKQTNGSASEDLSEEQVFGVSVDRQYIVSILTEIMNPTDFAPEDTIYLDMFIARNLPKYPQYLLLPGSTLTKVLTGLCHYPGQDLAEDAQLSAEYLLSMYHPPDIATLIPLFKQAGFYRILKRTYRVDKQYGKLIRTYFEDPDDRDGTFECIASCLRPQTGLTRRQIQDVHQVIKTNLRELVELDPVRTAKTLDSHAHELHQHVLNSVADEPELQYDYLKAVLESSGGLSLESKAAQDRDLIEQYVQLMCKYNPTHVSDYIGLIQSTDLRLENLLPKMEEAGVIDAAVVLMAKDGQVQKAMGRLVQHLETLESALRGLFSGADSGINAADLQDSAEELLKTLQKYAHVGIWLCQGQSKTVRDAGSVRRRQKPPANDLSPDETLWLSLIDTSVQITRRLSSAIYTLSDRPFPEANGEMEGRETAKYLDSEKLLSLLRSLVQHTFTALLTTTSTPAVAQPGSRAASNVGNNLSFLRILRAFLSRAAVSSPNLADLRAVLSSIFSAYAYEESILRLANRLLERSLFVSVSQAVEFRQRGWRPKGSTCEACGRRVWGPGVAGNIFEAWEDKQAIEEQRRSERKALAARLSTERGKGKESQSGVHANGSYSGKGKGKGKETDPTQPREDGESGPNRSLQELGSDAGRDSSLQRRDEPLSRLVVLACRHIYHQTCLDALQAKEGGRHVDEYGREREYRCPIDG